MLSWLGWEVIKGFVVTLFQEGLISMFKNKEGTSMTDFMWKLVGATVVVGSILFGAWSWHKTEVIKAVTAAEARVDQSYRLALDEQRKRLTAASGASEKALQEKFNKLEGEKNAEIQKLNTNVDTLLGKLRNRPTARDTGSSVSNNAGAKPAEKGSTGLQLSRPDAEFLTRFSGYAAELQTELKSCIVKYNTAKESLDKYKEEYLK